MIEIILNNKQKITCALTIQRCPCPDRADKLISEVFVDQVYQHNSADKTIKAKINKLSFQADHITMEGLGQNEDWLTSERFTRAPLQCSLRGLAV